MATKFTVTGFAGRWLMTMQAERQRVAAAATAAMRQEAAAVKQAARAQIRAAGFSARFAQALRVESFPKPGRVSAHPAAWVYHAASWAWEFEEGAVLRGHPFMWVALPGVPTKIGPKRMTPRLFRQNIGRLRRVDLPGRNPLLVVAARVAKTHTGGRFTVAQLRNAAERAAGIRRAGSRFQRRTIPVFVGIDRLTVAKRIHVRRICEAARDQLAGAILRNFKE